MMRQPQDQRYFEWIAANMSKGTKIGVHPMQVAQGGFKDRSDFFKKKGMELVPVMPHNLVDEVWADKQPPLPEDKVIVHKLEYAGRSV